MQQTDDRSLKELLGDLTQNVTTLFRKEIELARAETSEKCTKAAAQQRAACRLPTRSSGRRQ